MSSKYNSNDIKELISRIEGQREKIRSLIKTMPSANARPLRQTQAEQENLLALLSDMEKASENRKEAIASLNLLTEVEKKWKDYNLKEKWGWLPEKDRGVVQTSFASLEDELKSLIAGQVKAILARQDISDGKKAEELKQDIVKKAPKGDLAEKASQAVLGFANRDAEELAKNNNRGGLVGLWKAIRDATKDADNEAWEGVHTTAVGAIDAEKKSGQPFKKWVVYILGALVLLLISLSVLFVVIWQPSEQFCLVESVACQPATRKAETDAEQTRDAATAESNNAATIAAVNTQKAEVIATSTRAAEIKLTLEAEEAIAEATANAIATLTQEAIDAERTRIVEAGQENIAEQQATLDAQATANAAAQACIGASQFGFEIVSDAPSVSPTGATYVSTPAPELLELPLATVRLTIRNTGECSWGLGGFLVELWDLRNDLEPLSSSAVSLQKDGQDVGLGENKIQVEPGEEAELSIFIRSRDSIDRRFILVLYTVAGPIILREPTIAINIPNWAVPQTPTPTPTFTPTPEPINGGNGNGNGGNGNGGNGDTPTPPTPTPTPPPPP